ncbi:MAG: hypothetical protein M1831_000348 [Alyxoria varia]|nr:MAG: hypothetical protein M1831_000348 [Alyxoria varia]
MSPPPEPSKHHLVPKFLNALTRASMKHSKADSGLQITHLPLPEHEKASQLAYLQEQARARGKELNLIYLDRVDRGEGGVTTPTPVRMATPDGDPSLTRGYLVQHGREYGTRTPSQEEDDDDDSGDHNPAPSTTSSASPKRHRIENWIAGLHSGIPSSCKSENHTISRKPVPVNTVPLSPTGTHILPSHVLKSASSPRTRVRSRPRPPLKINPTTPTRGGGGTRNQPRRPPRDYDASHDLRSEEAPTATSTAERERLREATLRTLEGKDEGGDEAAGEASPYGSRGHRRIPWQGL